MFNLNLLSVTLSPFLLLLTHWLEDQPPLLTQPRISKFPLKIPN